MDLTQKMEMEKRKRLDDGEAEGRRTRVKEVEGDPTLTMEQTATATEEEVEEFYAILRRVHEVMRYFGKGKEGEREGKGAAKKKVEIWKPSFKWEDFEEVNVNNMKTRDKKYAEEAVEENQVVPVALDLNVEPVPEPEPEPEPAPERI